MQPPHGQDHYYHPPTLQRENQKPQTSEIKLQVNRWEPCNGDLGVHQLGKILEEA